MALVTYSGGRTGDQYNILLFGETGAGKSTLINYLTNYFLNGSLDNLRIAIQTRHHKTTEAWRTVEKDLDDPMKSKTSECFDYDFSRNGIRFKFIDTPGLSDTQGTETDDLHINKIMAHAERTGTLAGIIIVINGTISRATATVHNTLVRLRGSIPDILLKNLLVVLTNCSAGTYNFEIKSLDPWIVPEANVFCMNNSALSKPKESWESNGKNKKAIQRDWDDSMEEIENLSKRITQLGHLATNAFGEMRKKREQIKSEVHGILLEVKKLQDLQNKLDSAKVAQKNIGDDIQKYSNFKQTKQVDYEELVDAAYHSTICMKHSVVCHEGCGLDYTQSQGHEIFKGCACMRGATCGNCKCDHTTHYHDKKKMEKKSKSVEEIIHEVKAMFDRNTQKGKELGNQITTLGSDIQIIKKVLDNKESQITICCEGLKKLCSHFNFVDELQSIINTMKQNARTLTSVKAREEAESRIDRIVILANRLSGNEMRTRNADPSLFSAFAKKMNLAK